MPFNFNVMLEFLSDKSRREQIKDDIDEKGVEVEEIPRAMQRYVDLFEATFNSVERGIAD